MDTIKEEYSYRHITASGTNTIAVGKCNLHAITINGTAAATISVFDGSTTVAVISTSAAPVSLFYKASIANTLIVNPSATVDITVVYSNH